MAKRKLPGVQLARRISLGVFLAAVTALTILHQKLPNMPSVDSLDPFGGVETLFKYLAGGELLKKIMPANIVLLAAIVALGVVVSRFFCGWICAFGALQGVFGWLGKKLFARKFTVPPKIDRALRWLKYPILVGVLYFTWSTGTLIIRPYDPLAAYGHLSAGLAAVWAEFAVGFVILVLTLAASMFYERAFCKYVCPMGAVNAILSRVPLFRIKREAKTCISCSRCDAVCPMNIDVSHTDTVSSPECIGCLECATACPTKKGTLSATIGGKRVKLSTVAVLGLGIYLGAMGVGALLGKLDFTGPSLAQKAQSGTLSISDIKGSSTWASVADSFGVDLGRLFKEAGVDSSKVPPETKLKDTGTLIGKAFEADTARIALAKILGVPYSGETAAAAPPAGAVAVPAAPTTPASAPHAVPDTQPTTPSTAQQSSQPPAATLLVPADFALEGTMSVQDIASALNASTASVLQKLGLPADFPTDKPLRDMKDQYGYTMPGLKEKFAK